MNDFSARGEHIRAEAKALVYEFMQASTSCQPGGSGMTQAAIGRECGLEWGSYPTAPITQQNYWVVALLRQLEEEGKVQRLPNSGPWVLK